MPQFIQSSGKYFIAIAAIAAAVGVRALLDPMLGRSGSTIALYGAIAVAVWAGGYRPGILAAVAGYLAVNYFFIEPRGSISLESAGDVGDLIVYIISAGVIVALGGAMHAARRRAEFDAEAAHRHARDLEREIADHRRTRASLESKEGDLQTVTDTMSAAVARCSKDLRYLWVNRLYAQWAGNGKTAEEMIGRPMQEILGAEAMERIRPHIEEVLSGRTVEYERYARRKVGRRWIQAVLKPTFDGADKPDGWVAVIHDIDDRKRAAEALRDAQDQMQIITDTMSAAVCRTGNDLRYLWMNPVYARWLGKPAKEAVGQPIAEVLGSQMREIAPYVARVLKGEQVSYERLADLPGLGRRWIAAVFTPILDALGQPDGWVTICTDIHDRRTVEDELRAGDRRKDDFLATLAHELRNPLAPIRNAVAILARKSSLDPELAWGREVIVRQVEQMSRLIDDLLDIERISRGKFLVRKERIDLERAVDMALEMSRPYVTAAGHRLSVLMPSERVVLDADPTRLAQVFSNLLNNAAKFTEPRGSISLTAALEGRTAVVCVEDSGIGFAPEVASRLFKPYTQLTGSHSRGGLGIGLSLVQGIVALHGGSVEARSAGQGRGAEFIVRLPLAAAAESFDAREKQRPAAAVPLPGFRVLVADDNKDAADSLQRVLGLYGYAVRVAYDGESALELGGTFGPQVAVLDIGMPGADGYQVARAMRERYGKNITLVALTGWGQENDRERSTDAGFDYHLTKPVDPGLLNELLVEIAAIAERKAG
jgi:PAS domain S-box-containing protein